MEFLTIADALLHLLVLAGLIYAVFLALFNGVWGLFGEIAPDEATPADQSSLPPSLA